MMFDRSCGRLWTCAFGALLACALGENPAAALDRPETTYKVYQFPQNAMPHIDGDGADWAMAPDSYVVDTSHLTDTDGMHPAPDPRTLDVKVKVGWVKDLNRLYFL